MPSGPPAEAPRFVVHPKCLEKVAWSVRRATGNGEEAKLEIAFDDRKLQASFVRDA
jgi:hypothetical protein